MQVLQSLGLSEKEVIALVGGGGKTTLMYRLAEEISPERRVVITTTTKIFFPPPSYPCIVVGDDAPDQDALNSLFQSKARPVLGSKILTEKKLKGLSLQQLACLWADGTGTVDYILVEADGARGLSLKGHLEYEPVIPPVTTLLVVVIGAEVIGKTLDSNYVHRPEAAAQMLGLKPGTVLESETIARLINHPRGILRNCPPRARVIGFINKIDLLENLDDARNLARILLEGRIGRVILGSAMEADPVVEVIDGGGGGD